MLGTRSFQIYVLSDSYISIFIKKRVCLCRGNLHADRAADPDIAGRITGLCGKDR